MIWRGPWDGAWDGSWEGEDQPLAPGFIRGAATISVGASGSPGAIVWASGTTTISLSANGYLSAEGVEPARSLPGGGWSWRRRLPEFEISIEVPQEDEDEIVEVVLLLVTSGILERDTHQRLTK